tara:strand:+ start:561 stop:794 length:234 start_codon:yes stop_codon:yes gene_type:complete
MPLIWADHSTPTVNKSTAYKGFSITLQTRTDSEGDDYIHFEAKKLGFRFCGMAPDEKTGAQRVTDLVDVAVGWKRYS